MASEAPTLTATTEGGELRLAAGGRWVAREARVLEQLVDITPPAQAMAVEIDMAGVEAIDTLGARLIERLRARLAEGGASIAIHPRDEAQQVLITEVAEKSHAVPPPRPASNGLVDWFADIGEVMRGVGRNTVELSAMLGAVVAGLGDILQRRTRLRMPSVVTQIERMAFNGVPIITLISFLVGAIIAQQTIFQLRQFGAAIFVVDLIGILMLREVGLLLAAIMVAGRSGSAITAELGSMKMREEVDALRVMGLSPMSVLVLPRIVSLLIGLPLLAFLASMAGILGGGLVAWIYGDITPMTFIDRLRESIDMSTFLVGMIKAPFMALMIGLIACNEGFKVEGSAESLGRRTTSSVVQSIFVVIVADGLFAMFFAAVDF